MLRKAISILTAAVLCLCLLPVPGFALGSAWEQGNSDLNILNGGVMLDAGDDFYFVQDGIFVKRGETLRALSADSAKNLNLYDGYLYYTLGYEIRRVPADGGKAETVFTADAEITQLYLVNGEFLYLSGGAVYEKRGGGGSTPISPVSDVKGFIPTQYGNIYLTGKALHYELWAGGSKILSDVSSCYTDSGKLAVQIGNKNYMAELEGLFDGFDAVSDLKDFNIHGTVSLYSLLSPDDENAISENNDNNELQVDFKALLREAGLSDSKASLMEETNAVNAAVVVPELSEGQKNIVKRARQLTEIKWTPLEDITQWGYYGTFKAETTYTGIPYGQPVNTNGYIGYGVSLEAYASAVLDNTSRFYTTYSTYNKIAPVFSTDCSGYVSYAWGLTTRKTTYSLMDVADKVGDQSVYSLQVGDCLDKSSSHTVLISALSYDANGSIIGLQVMEETPVITRVTNYGAGQSKSLASFQAYYLDGGFVIYRSPGRDSVTYTPSPLVPLDGESVPGQKEPAPKTHTSSFIGGKTVALSSDTAGASIYYTLDGSTPTATSKPYSGPITVGDTTKLRAIAVSQNFSDSTILEYTVKVPQAALPTATVASGMSSGELVSSGSQIKLSAAQGSTIYYTTDGTQPTTSGKVYSSPITINRDATIKAIAVAPGTKQSETAVLNYRVGAVYTLTASAQTGGSISPSGASSLFATGSKTYTIKASDGYAIGDVLVDGVSVGAVTSYSFQNLSANHTISASFKLTAQMGFADVGADQWFYNAVGFVFAKGLFNGTSETAFSPDMTMTRGMFVTVLGRFAGLPSGLKSGTALVIGTGVNIRSGPSTDTEVAGYIPTKNTVVQITSQSGDWYAVKYGSVTGYIRKDLLKVYAGSYTDLASDMYYSPYAEWVSLTGIANGVAGSTFNANSDITREHMCVLLYNYALTYGKTLPAAGEKATFTDDSAISAGAKNAVYALQQAGVINGMGDGTFSPQGTATRAQVAQIFMKFVNSVG